MKKFIGKSELAVFTADAAFKGNIGFELSIIMDFDIDDVSYSTLLFDLFLFFFFCFSVRPATPIFPLHCPLFSFLYLLLFPLFTHSRPPRLSVFSTRCNRLPLI